MHSTLHLHIELYVCMYFIACYFELLLWTIYMNCNIDICVTCVTVNELWKR